MPSKADQIAESAMLADIELKRAAHAGKSSLLASQVKHLIAENERLEQLLGIADTLTVKPNVSWPKQAKKSTGSETVALILFSDWHVGERVTLETTNGLNEYNPGIVEQSVINTVDGIIKLVDAERSLTKIDKAVVWLGGDFVTGEIHDELKETNTLSETEEVFFAYEQLSKAINRLSGYFDEMKFVGSVGNHSRNTKKTQAKNEYRKSSEWQVYRKLSKDFSDKRFSWDVSKSYLTTTDILGHIIGWQHGHRISYSSGIGGPLIPLIRSVGKQSMHEATRFDISISGHFHQFFWVGNVIGNGSMIGVSEYGAGKFVYQRPSQTVAFLNQSHGLVAAREVFCR